MFRKITLLFVCLGLMFSGCQSGKKAERERFAEIPKSADWLAGSAEEPVTYSGEEKRLILPFYVISARAGSHVIAWFDGHPEYESVEAFVYRNNKIRAILTRHDNTQIDAYNYETDERSASFFNRERYTTDISFRLASNNRDAELKLDLPDGRPLTLIYLGQDEPDSQYGGMTDVGLHSPDGGLPVFFRDTSSVSQQGSYVKIAGEKYPVPVDEEISVRPFFVAYSAFLSGGYSSFILPTFARKPVPVSDKTGITGSGSTETRIITSGRDGVNEIENIISGSPGLSDKEARSEIRFNPPLPNLYAMPEGKQAAVRFAVFFNGGLSEEMYGDIIISKSGSSVTLLMRPQYPGWAKESRCMKYVIDLQEDSAMVTAAMEK